MSFPRTTVAGISLPRLLIGTNWIFGWSHTGSAADKYIKERHSCPDATASIFDAFLSYGVDAVMGPFSSHPECNDRIKYFEDKTGKKIIRIDTPHINVDDNEAARKDANAVLKTSGDIGCAFCLIHHACCEQLVNKNKRTIERIGDYTDMIRQAGVIPGLSAHMPEIIQYSDSNNYDIETYIQIFNCAGFLMQVEVEPIIKIIHEAKKPVMTIKPMAAGRLSPYVGLTFNFSVLRPQDMVTAGCISKHEVHEVVEISKAALDRRLPNLEGRSSPVKTSIIK